MLTLCSARKLYLQFVVSEPKTEHQESVSEPLGTEVGDHTDVVKRQWVGYDSSKDQLSSNVIRETVKLLGLVSPSSQNLVLDNTLKNGPRSRVIVSAIEYLKQYCEIACWSHYCLFRENGHTFGIYSSQPHLMQLLARKTELLQCNSDKNFMSPSRTYIYVRKEVHLEALINSGLNDRNNYWKWIPVNKEDDPYHSYSSWKHCGGKEQFASWPNSSILTIEKELWTHDGQVWEITRVVPLVVHTDTGTCHHAMGHMLLPGHIKFSLKEIEYFLFQRVSNLFRYNVCKTGLKNDSEIACTGEMQISVEFASVDS